MPVPLKAIANTFRMEAEFLKFLLGDKEDRHCLSDLERQTIMYFFRLLKDSKRGWDIHNFTGGVLIAWGLFIVSLTEGEVLGMASFPGRSFLLPHDFRGPWSPQRKQVRGQGNETDTKEQNLRL